MEQLYQAVERLAGELESAVAQDQQTAAVRLADSIHDRLLIYKRTSSREVSSSAKHKYSKHLDFFDSAGVRFFNKSTLLRAGKVHDTSDVQSRDSLCLVAALRRTGSLLVELGRTSPQTEVSESLRLLELITKAGIALTVVSKLNQAEETFNRADLQLTSITQASADLSSSAVVHACLSFYLARADSSQQQNPHLAQPYLDKALALRTHCNPADLKLLVTRNFNHAKALYDPKANNEKPKQAEEAIDWLIKGPLLVLSEACNSRKSDVEVAHTSQADDRLSPLLKIPSLKLLASAYLYTVPMKPSNIELADATIDQILELQPSFKLYRRKALIAIKRRYSEKVILNAFRLAVIHLDGKKTEALDKLLTDIHGLPQNARSQKLDIVALVTKTLVSPEQASETAGELVGKALLSLIILATTRDITSVDSAIKEVNDANSSFTLPNGPCLACQSLLWALGDKAIAQKDFDSARRWFLLTTTSPLFSSMEKATFPKAYRKSAVCALHGQDYHLAKKLLDRPLLQNDACTFYILFLASGLAGDEAPALQAVSSMVQAPNFKVDMLLRAVQQQYDFASESKVLLSRMLSMVHDATTKLDGICSVNELVLIRCLVRLTAAQLEDESNSSFSLEDNLSHLCEQLSAAVHFLKQQSPAHLLEYKPDLEWLFVTAYNLGLQGIKAKWPVERITTLFDLLSRLASLDPTTVDGNAESLRREIVCRFTALSARMECLGSATPTAEAARDLLDAIQDLRSSFTKTSESAVPTLHTMRNATISYELKLHLAIQRWQDVSNLITSASQDRSVSSSILQSLADSICRCQELPLDILSSCLKNVLGALVHHKALDVATFARWLRQVSDLQLANGDVEDALYFLQQASSLLRSKKHAYPQDEIEWLLAVTWDSALDLQQAIHPAAGSYFELALSIVGYSTEREKLERQVQNRYTAYMNSHPSHSTGSDL